MRCKTLFLALTIMSAVANARVQLDTSIQTFVSKAKRSVSNVSNIQIAQKKFEGFIGCGKQIGSSMVLNDSPAYRCVEQFLHPDAGPGNILNYLMWLQQDSKISKLGACPDKELKLIEFLKTDDLGIYYCFLEKSEQTTKTGIIQFRLKQSDPLIYEIKLP